MSLKEIFVFAQPQFTSSVNMASSCLDVQFVIFGPIDDFWIR